MGVFPFFFTVLSVFGGTVGTFFMVGSSFCSLLIASTPVWCACDPFEVVFPRIVPEDYYIHCITYISIASDSSLGDTHTGISKQAMNEPQILC